MYSLILEKSKKISKCEANFPISLWMKLKNGDYVIYRKSGRLVQIAKGRNGFIRMRSGAVYVGCDRHYFAPVTYIWERPISLQDFLY
jgi:hypothetical protein